MKTVQKADKRGYITKHHFGTVAFFSKGLNEVQESSFHKFPQRRINRDWKVTLKKGSFSLTESTEK